MAACVAFFVLGFLTDKIRLFPFLLGIILGVILKSLFENPCMLDDHQNLATRVYDTIRSTFTTDIEKDQP
jgi:multisubunit Na+/H+ antiporter MnhE subunit